MTSKSARPMRPLNVGDVVSAGISLLRSNFKTFSGLSIKAALWFLVPVYGWARGIMIYAQIGRMGFQEMRRQPETATQSLRAVEPRLWPFLGIALLVFLIQMAVSYALSFAVGIVILPISLVGSAGEAMAVLSALLAFVAQLVVLGAQMWVQARLFLWDLILALEPELESTAAITRSWELTKGSGVRILLTLLVSYLVILPLYALMIVIPLLVALPFLGSGFLEGGGNEAAVLGILLALLVFLVLAFGVIVLASPFFQTIKSVLYYDLRSRREGLDIQLRDRPQYPRDL
ncbi:MAG: hypothetical protein ACFBSG_12140 [Leptolyngbyaceae cyanobacterium]